MTRQEQMRNRLFPTDKTQCKWLLYAFSSMFYIYSTRVNFQHCNKTFHVNAYIITTRINFFTYIYILIRCEHDANFVNPHSNLAIDSRNFRVQKCARSNSKNHFFIFCKRFKTKYLWMESNVWTIDDLFVLKRINL